MTIVWKTQVISKNFFEDLFASLKNIIGGRIITYEKMMNKTLNELTKEFTNDYPTAKNIRIEFQEFTHGANMVIIYGEINE